MNKELNKQLGAILQDSRKKRGYTVRYVAEKMGKGHSTISDHELGKTTLSLDVFLEYCKFYDLDANEVLKKLNYK